MLCSVLLHILFYFIIMLHVMFYILCYFILIIIIIIIQFICIAPESIVLLSGASHNVQIVAKIKLLLK